MPIGIININTWEESKYSSAEKVLYGTFGAYRASVPVPQPDVVSFSEAEHWHRLIAEIHHKATRSLSPDPANRSPFQILL
jgi:hypothetical protein